MFQVSRNIRSAQGKQQVQASEHSYFTKKQFLISKPVEVFR